jgi:cytochrome c-type biogenesis protein CcmH/NrfF
MGSCPMRPNCGHYDTQAAALDGYLAEGMDHDAVVAAFVENFGSQAVLAAPVDTGFNRLAWLFPYLAAAAGLIGIVATTRRWSRQAPPAAAGDAHLDPALSARLDDELRNLD